MASAGERRRADDQQREQHLALPGAVGEAAERDAAREGDEPDAGERDAGLRGREPDRPREEDRRDREVEPRPGPVDQAGGEEPGRRRERAHRPDPTATNVTSMGPQPIEVTLVRRCADEDVCIAGATGWTGSALVRGVREAPDLTLGSAVSRSAAGGEIDGAPVYGSAAEALDGIDVLIDYTSVEAVKGNALAAIEAGVAVVIGTSGLTADDFAEIDAAARARSVGVVSSGNFSLTAAMASAAALLAARHLPQWEVIDYASATKPDVPSGTARELAERLGEVRTLGLGRRSTRSTGRREARGASVAGTQVHSVRLPSFVVSTEVVFGLPDERLTIRHDAGGTPEPYVAGTLIAVRRVRERPGLTRGLDTLAPHAEPRASRSRTGGRGRRPRRPRPRRARAGPRAGSRTTPRRTARRRAGARSRGRRGPRRGGRSPRRRPRPA